MARLAGNADERLSGRRKHPRKMALPSEKGGQRKRRVTLPPAKCKRSRAPVWQGTRGALCVSEPLPNCAADTPRSGLVFRKDRPWRRGIDPLMDYWKVATFKATRILLLLRRKSQRANAAKPRGSRLVPATRKTISAPRRVVFLTPASVHQPRAWPQAGPIDPFLSRAKGFIGLRVCSCLCRNQRLKLIPRVHQPRHGGCRPKPATSQFKACACWKRNLKSAKTFRSLSSAKPRFPPPFSQVWSFLSP